MAQLKNCSKCKVEKPLIEFHRHNTSKDGHVSTCKPCAIERAKSWYYENREQHLERLRGDKSRNNHYKTRFKISLDDFINLSELQKFICANPGCNEAAKDQRNGVLVVDHDRSCCSGTNSCGTCLRGLLCQGCNKALGLLKEDMDRILGLINYIKIYSLEGGSN